MPTFAISNEWDQVTTFGDLLKYLRRRAGLTQLELSIAVGYSGAQISRIEHNHRVPDLATILAHFVPALHLKDEPKLLARLLELAASPHASAGPLSVGVAFPDAAAPAARPHNLPHPLSALIGRKQELADLVDLIRCLPGNGARLVTLVGPGGCGKTRLAIHAGLALFDNLDDGAWLVELAPLADPSAVSRCIASALAVRERPNESLLVTLANGLRPLNLLLILDNCEHLLSSCAQVAQALLQAAPNLRILATSRQPLGIPGEKALTVPPLSFPEALSVPDEEELSQFEAIQLFVARAVAVRPDFRVTSANTPALVEISHRLDGMPLAIELAAARTAVLSPEAIAERLDAPFRLLTGGSRAGPARQQTLQATINWSHSLLNEPQRILFQRLAIFASGWTLSAAEAVCVGEALASGEVLESLSDLVDQSLVVADSKANAPEARFRMLETIRQFAHEQLRAAGELEAMQLRHLDYYLQLGESLEPKLKTGERLKRKAQLTAEHNNLGAAIQWALGSGPETAKKGLRLVSALRLYWHWGGFHTEARQWIEYILALPMGHADVPAGLRAKALYAAGYLARFQADPTDGPLLGECITLLRADSQADPVILADALNMAAWAQEARGGEYIHLRAIVEESVALCRTMGKAGTWDLAQALFWLGHWQRLLEDFPAARASARESARLFREAGDIWHVAAPLSLLGHIAFRQGNYVLATAHFAEGLQLMAEIGDQWAVAAWNDWLGDIDRCQRDTAAARERFQASERLWRHIGDRLQTGIAIRNLGLAALFEGDDSAGEMYLRESLALIAEVKVPARDELQAPARLALNLAALGVLASRQGRSDRAGSLLGAAMAIAERHPFDDPYERADKLDFEDLLRVHGNLLEDPGLMAAVDHGRMLTVEQAVAEALAVGS